MHARGDRAQLAGSSCQSVLRVKKKRMTMMTESCVIDLTLDSDTSLSPEESYSDSDSVFEGESTWNKRLK